MPIQRIMLFPQDKGGIGKSFVATLLHDYLTDAGVRVHAFDRAHANSAFNRLVSSAECSDTDVDADQRGVLDRIVRALPDADVVLVDNHATGGRTVLACLDETRRPERPNEFGGVVVFVVIATDDQDANSQIAELLDAHGRRVRWLVARNLRDGGNLDLFSQSKVRQRLLASGAVEIDVPCLAEVTKNRLQQANLTVGRGRQSDALHLLDRSRCGRFHDLMKMEFGKARELLLP
jgi:hypothetical protein